MDNNMCEKANVDLLERILNWTLPGLQFFYRDTDFPYDTASLYEKLRLFRVGFFMDCSARAGRLTKKTRFIIASAHSAAVWAMMPWDEDMQQWRMHTFHYNSYFKVMDVYRVGDKTQVCLLHIPYQGIPFFHPETSMVFDLEGVSSINIVELARRSFDDKMQMEPIAALESEAWVERTFQLPGLYSRGIVPFEPDESPIPKAKEFGDLIHELAKDDDELNRPKEL